MYKVKNGKVSGKEALELKEAIERVNQVTGANLEKKLDDYKREVDRLSADILKLK